MSKPPQTNSQPSIRRTPAADDPALAPDILRRLYIDEGLSLKQVADRIGPPASKRIVQRALQRHGVPLRDAIPPARSQALMSKEELERFYVDEGRSLPEVAAIFEVNPATVIKRMRQLGIDRRKGAWRSVGGRQPMTRDLLWELRVVQRLSAHRIGEMLGYSEVQVRSGLKRHGIFDPSHNNSLAYELGAGELWWLHHHEGLSVKAIAQKLRASPQKVADRIEELAVTQRGHGKMPRPDDLPPGIPAPDLNLLEAVLQKAALKPPSVQQVGLIDDASDEELRRLHLEQGKGLTEIGRLYGSAPETVRRRFERADIEIRHRRGRRGMGPLTTKSYEKLMSLYSRAGVKGALGRLGIPLRGDGASIEPPVDLTRDVVESLYRDLRLTLEDVGLLTDRSQTAVGRAIRHHKLTPRKHLPEPVMPLRVPRSLFDYNALREQTTAGLDAETIARQIGLASPTPVRVAAQVLELPLPGGPGPLPVPEQVINEVRLSRVSAEHAGRVIEPRHLGLGAGRGLAQWPWPPGPALVEYLYRTLDIGAVECADRLRCGVEEFNELVVSYGLQLRTTDEFSESDRWRLDPEELRFMYVDQGARVEDIAAVLGVDANLIYRAMHRNHLPVSRYSGEKPRVRYDELLANPQVVETLAAVGIEPAGIDPPNRRQSLPGELLRTLIGELGLTPFDLELLTGRQSLMVRNDCLRFGIKGPEFPPGITVDLLREMYEVKLWPMNRISRELGLKGESELRTLLRKAGIPKRSFKANPWDTRRKSTEKVMTEEV